MSAAPPRIHLVLGGARSGKSAYAESLALRTERPVVCVTTCATAFADAEMRERIRSHRARRPTHWTTLEDRFDLETLFRSHPGCTLLVDCLTLWLSFHSFSVETLGEEHLLRRLESAVDAARDGNVLLLCVSNELGLGLVPSSPLGRSFRDLAGRANQRLAARADAVDFLVAGLPLRLKGPPLP
jgi:adenosylcobinamide kinase/adenosylcobinamide-phosphate guanylyltransferase